MIYTNARYPGEGVDQVKLLLCTWKLSFSSQIEQLEFGKLFMCNLRRCCSQGAVGAPVLWKRNHFTD